MTLSLPAATFADKLLDWYDNNRRILPWREDPTPYHVWLSEIMLQQTQVQTVIAYYERFLNALPTIDALAAVDEDRLHKLWEGLGYYSRADNLHKTAKILMRSYEGQLPESYSTLLTLPGIGPYTAGAIASIAFGERISAVDGNVLRILSRLLAYDEPVNVAASAKPLKELAQAIVPAHRPGDFNQALMDLGAMVCSANGAPHCANCPVAVLCEANARQIAAFFPVKRPKKPRTVEMHTIVILHAGRRIWIRKRPKGQLLAGLWEFLDLPGAITEAAALTTKLETLGISPRNMDDLGKARHVFTHKEWHMQGWLVESAEPAIPIEGRWVDLSALETTYAMAGAISYYRQRLFNHLL